MAKNSSPNKVVTGKVRLSYVNLLQPRASEEGEKPKYSVMLLIPKKDEKTVAKLRAAATAALKDGIAKGIFKSNAKLDNVWKTLKDGDDHEDVDNRPEYAGNWLMNVSSATKPAIVDTDLDPIMEEGEVYSGMYARVSLGAFAYDSKKSKGVSFGLNNVQKLEDGERLGGGSTAEEDFGDDLDDLI